MLRLFAAFCMLLPPGMAAALQSVAGTNQAAYASENTIVTQQMITISNTTSVGLASLQASMTLLAACGDQAKFYNTSAKTCCSCVSDTSPRCPPSN